MNRAEGNEAEIREDLRRRIDFLADHFRNPGDRVDPPSRPVLLWDEDVNDRRVEQMARRLASSGRFSGYGGAWVEFHAVEGSDPAVFAGGPPRRGTDDRQTWETILGGRIGPRIVVPSFPDLRVVQEGVLGGILSGGGRAIFLTGNTRRDPLGVRALLTETVGPQVEEHSDILGFLVIFRRQGSSMERFVASVGDLLGAGMGWGYREEWLPEA